jgi:hypothetical protein
MPEAKSGRITALDYGKAGRHTVTIGGSLYRAQDLDVRGVDWCFGDEVQFDVEPRKWGLPIATNIRKAKVKAG